MSFDIHIKQITEPDKIILRQLIVHQNRKVYKNDFKIECVGCNKEKYISQLYRCFYCSLWFCTKCAKDHFGENKRS